MKINSHYFNLNKYFSKPSKHFCGLNKRHLMIKTYLILINISSGRAQIVSTECSLPETCPIPSLNFILSPAVLPHETRTNIGQMRFELDLSFGEFIPSRCGHRSGTRTSVPVLPYRERQDFATRLRSHEPVCLYTCIYIIENIVQNGTGQRHTWYRPLEGLQAPWPAWLGRWSGYNDPQEASLWCGGYSFHGCGSWKWRNSEGLGRTVNGPLNLWATTPGGTNLLCRWLRQISELCVLAESPSGKIVDAKCGSREYVESLKLKWLGSILCDVGRVLWALEINNGRVWTLKWAHLKTM